MWKYSLFSILLLSASGYHDEPCSKYGCPLAPPIHIPFVPAPPGHTPRCAKPGLTFCESLEQYPQQLIKFLIEQRDVDFEKFLRDESQEDFNAYSKKPDYEYGYDYPKPKVPAGLYAQASSFLQAAQLPTSHRYQVPLNATHNRYLPAAVHANPFISESAASVSSHRSFGWHRASGHPFENNPDLFDANENPWLPRNTGGVGSGEQRRGWTRYQNPLLEFAARAPSRPKRQADSNAVSICQTRSIFVVPKAALNNQGNWMFVVNLEKQAKYSQLVRSEICMSETCDGLCSLPLGYTSKCQQQYVQKRLVALEGSGDRLYTDVFWFPHGCMCQVMLDY